MTLNKKILLVDDEPDILELLGHSFSNMGYECISASSLTQALEKLYEHEYFLCLNLITFGANHLILMHRLLRGLIHHLLTHFFFYLLLL